MNQYPKTAVVQAQYSGQQRGNPFLEAMPSIMPYKMLMDEIASGPLIPVQPPHLPLGRGGPRAARVLPQAMRPARGQRNARARRAALCRERGRAAAL